MQNLENLIKNKQSITFLISRTDAIGDVALTLPMTWVLKELYPKSKILFLGKTYTKPIVECCKNVDKFLNWDEVKDLGEKEQIEFLKKENIDVFIHVFPNKQIAKLASKSNISVRIGTSHRIYNWIYCNKNINFSRKKSPYHEAQLNLKLIECLGVKKLYNLDELYNYCGFEVKNINTPVDNLIDKNKFNLILHPKSKGSAREWGVDNFNKLISILPEDKFNIFVSGTKEEGDLIKKDILEPNKGRINDITGKLTLDEFVSFISKADGLIAASTGPLHIASLSGSIAIGIYPPIKPMHPGRWKPIGDNIKVFCKEKDCSDCRKTSGCQCMKDIKPEMVAEYLVQISSKL